MQHLWLIPAFPLAGFFVNLIFGRRFSKAVINTVAVGASVLAFVWAVKTLLSLGSLESAYIERYFTWISSGSLNIGFDLSVDRLTAVMLLVVTGVGSLIHIYSIGYMAHEGGYYRFFAYMNLFMFFMLTLVLGANFLVLFVGWEGVGLCSYLLIGFFFLKESAGDAGKKAFIVNRIGDYGFLLAMFLIFINFGSLDFGTVFSKAAGMPVEQTGGVLTIITLLLLMGATGKSAQIPLYVWLPDAMEGPTPVSALIHAATMVTAGVYMCARSATLFNHAPMAMDAVAVIGLLTAAVAATIGMTQYDIKKVYAYSTVSQLGYMFLGVGVGAYSAGIWHLMTHAFFKGLLFLGAGSVIHAMSGEQDMRKMGGLRTKIPVTFLTLLCASVAISGVPPFSGFFSKDAILVAAHAKYPWMYWVGVITAGLTAFYIFRALFMTFFGKHRGGVEHPHESPLVITIPLSVLALLSLVGGYIDIPRYLEPIFGSVEAHEDITLVIASIAAGLIGIGVAYLFYVASPGLPEALANRLGWVYRLVYDKYRVDELYASVVVNPVTEGSRLVLWKGMDLGIIDAMVNGVGGRAKAIGGVLKRLQSGYIRNYAALVMIGAIIALVAAGLLGGAR